MDEGSDVGKFGTSAYTDETIRRLTAQSEDPQTEGTSEKSIAYRARFDFTGTGTGLSPNRAAMIASKMLNNVDIILLFLR